MIRFKSALKENSFWKDQAEKNKFVADDKLVMNAFIFSFIGTLAFLHGAKDNSRAKVYFRSDQKLRVDTITDDNNDVSLIIKIMADQSFFKTIQTVNEITRFLVKVKAGQVDTVDENIIRGWINNIKPDKLKNLSAVVRRELKDFMDGGSLATFGDQLKANAKVTRWKNSEFHDLVKTLRMDPAKKKAQPLSTTPVVTTPSATSDDSSSNIIQTKKISASLAPSKPAPVVKIDLKVMPTVDAAKAVYDDLVSGFSSDEIASKYGKVPPPVKTSLILMVSRNASLPYQKDPDGFVKSYIEVLKATPMRPHSSWAEDFLPVANIDNNAAFDAYMKYVPWGNVPKLKRRDERYMARLFDSIIRRSGVAIDSSYDELVQLKSKYPNLFSSTIFKDTSWAFAIQSNMGKLLMRWLSDADRESFLSLALTYDPGLVKVGQDYRYNFDLSPSITRHDGGRTSPSALIKYYKIPASSKMDKILSEIDNGRIWRIIENDLTLEMVPDFMKEVKKDPNRFVKMFRAAFGSGSWRPRDFKHPTVQAVLSGLINDPSILDMTTASLIKNGVTYDIDNALTPAQVAKFLNSILNNVKKFGDQHIDWDDIDSSYEYFRANGLGQKKEVTSVFKTLYLSKMKQAINSSSYRRGKVYGEHMTPSNPLWDWTTEDEKDQLDNLILDIVLATASASSWNRYTTANKPIRKFDNMSKKTQDRVMSLLLTGNETTRNQITPILNGDFFKALSYENLDQIFPNNTDIFNFISSDDEQEVFNKHIKNPKFREKIDFTVKNAGRSDRVSKIIMLMETSNEYDVPEYTQIIKQFIQNQSEFELNRVAAAHTAKSTFNRKSGILFETYTRKADEKFNKLTSEYKSFMTSAQAQFMNYVDYDRKKAEAFYTSVTKSMRKRFAAQYLQRGDFTTSAKAALIDPKNPIKPFDQLTDKRIKEILKYNNVTSEESKLPDSVTRDFSTLDAYLKKSHASSARFKDLAITEIAHTSDELNQISADYHRQKRAGKHGETSMVFKRAFTVSLKFQEEQQAAWIAKDPKQEIIKPMYHGTGSVAASMILRYGWRVIRAGDSSVAGRMLGDGVYGAIHIDKSQQYVGDAGYGRTYGTKGYIFVMNAALGEKNKDYRSMGLGNDHIRSPEWCVYTPNSQFRILRAYEVELVRPDVIREIMGKYPKNGLLESENVKRFKSYLSEEADVNQWDGTQVSTYTFVNGLVPTDKNPYVELEDFVSPGEGITLEYSAYGPSVVILNTETSGNYVFTGPDDLIENHPDVYREYISHFEKARAKK